MEKNRRTFSLLTSLFLLLIVAASFTQKQAIYDWLQLREYTPPVQIAQIASDTTMNDYGKHLFYVYHPQLQSRDQFNQNCSESEQTIVLGCYVPAKGIYLYDINDKRLDGVEEVTAAHEMLHAAYDRLSPKERKRIDQLTEQAFKNVTDKRLLKTLEAYRSKDPSVVPDELHSIIGTEVRNIPQELETYYKKYFTNRLRIVEYSEKYEAAFTELEDQAKAYKEQLDRTKAQIDLLTKQLDEAGAKLKTEYEALQARRSAAEPAEFNAAVDVFNSKVTLYNQQVKEVSTLIDSYNAILTKYNAIVLQENTLINAIDSRPQTLQKE